MKEKGQQRSGIRIAALVLVLSGLWLWASAAHPSIFTEHGPMENFQAACLLAGALLLAWGLRYAVEAERVLLAGLTLLYFTFLLLEFDTRTLDWHAAHKVLNGPVRNAWLGSLWLLAFVGFARDARNVAIQFRHWLRKPAGIRLLVAGAFWVAGALAEKLPIFSSKAHNLLAEELLEINAAVLMLWSALATLQHILKRKPSVPALKNQPAVTKPLPKSSH